MIARIFLLLAFTAALLAENADGGNTVSNLIEGDLPFTIQGIINPVSGLAALSELDAEAPSLCPTTIDRTYIPHLYNRKPQGWAHGNYGRLYFLKSYLPSAGKEVCLGAGVWGAYKELSVFSAATNGHLGKNDFEYDLYAFEVGQTNLTGPEISGRTHPKNQILKGDSRTLDHFYLTTGAGLQLHFDPATGKEDRRISKKIFPNGHYTTYHYNKDVQLTEVKNFSRTHAPLSSAKYLYGKNWTKIELSNGSNVRYDFVKDRWNIKKATPSDGPVTEYAYDKKQRLIKKIKPDGRELKIHYVVNENLENDAYFYADKNPFLVASISVPSNTDGSFAEVIKLNHKQLDDSYVLRAFDMNDHFTEYRSQKGFLRKIIQKNYDNTSDYTVQEYFWGKHDASDPGCLKAITMAGPRGEIFFAKNYLYDNMGNPLFEHLWGNLTGKRKDPLYADSEGRILSQNAECFTLKKTFYAKKNLLKSEDDGFRERRLSYHLDTDLIQKELTLDQGKIRERHFFFYDDNLVLTEEVIDDGSTENFNDLAGVTERQILRKGYKNPLSGLASEESVYFLDLKTGEELLFSRKEKDYNARGAVTRERYFDSQNNFLYELGWEYDRHGNVIRETGALGTEILREYDQNDNLVLEIGPTFNREKRYVYDKMDRLIEEIECFGEEVYTTSHTYDPLSRKKKTVNRYGYTTRYAYDFAGRVKAIHEGSDRLIKKSYHPSGYIAALTDPEGSVTFMEYTVRGQPCRTCYPDGTEESWEYNVQGYLVRHTDTQGLASEYLYDYKGRVVEEKRFDSLGQYLFSKTKRYNAFHLISETDEAGNTLLYEYDAKGQLVKTVKNGLKTKLIYDIRGLLKEKITDNKLFESYTYDLVGRLTSDIKKDENGFVLLKTTKSYDEFGRTIAESQGEYVTRFVYNSKDELVEKILPDGRVLRYEYNHKYMNAYGEHVLLKKEFDPKGGWLEKEYDTRQREVRVCRYDAFGGLLQQSFKTYSPNDKVTRVKEEIFYRGVKERDYILTYDYDAMGRPLEIAEEKGTAYEKRTFFAYNALGQKVKTMKPNGVVTTYTYDAQGRVCQETSSDQTIDYQISYDLYSHPVEARDLIHHTSSRYIYNSEGRVLREELATEEAVENRYDLRGRLVEVKHKRLEPINFSYDGLFLREVNWKNLKARYNAYDLAGNLLKGDDITYSYDAASRLKSWSRHNQSENIDYDILGNLVRRELLGVETRYDYDSLNQLEKESGAYEKSYTHDSHYNRRSKDGFGYTLDPLNCPIAYQSSRYVWDRNGNLLCREEGGHITEYLYDARDRLIALKEDGSLKASYFWDEQNRCLKINEASFLYQGRAEVGSIENDKVTSFRVLGLGRGQEAGASLWIEVDGACYKPLHDLSGNLIGLADLDYNLVSYTPLSAFGEALEESVIPFPWGFASKRLDTNSNLVLFGYRFYDPSMGRFTTADPAGFDAGPNLWAYCNNNPLTFSDLFGLSAIAYLNDEPGTPTHEKYASEESNLQDSQPETNNDKTDHYPEIETCCLGHMAGSSVKLVCYAVGDGLETVSFHTIPRIPGVKDIPMATAYLLKHGSFKDYVPTHRRCSRIIEVGSKPPPPNSSFGDITGMATTYDDALKRSEAISELGDDFRTRTLQLETHGFVSDSISSTLNKLGFSLHAGKLAKQFMQEGVQEAGEDGTFYLSGHSRGNLVACCASRDLKREGSHITDQIHYTGLASPTGMSEKTFGDITIYMSDRDPVCLFAGRARFRPPNHVKILHAPNGTFIEHSFDSQTYFNQYRLNHLQPYLNHYK